MFLRWLWVVVEYLEVVVGGWRWLYMGLGGGWCASVTIDAFLLPFRKSSTFLVTFLLF